jgi:uncharacterized phage infection (PIP) family protein YhgE
MLLVNETKNFVEDLLTSYESRIQTVETLFQAAQQVVQNFHESVLDTKQEREKLNDQLKENLAKSGSLRKKDFDNMMRDISSRQNQQEQEIRNLSKDYLKEQTDFIQELRNNLRNFREALAKGEAQRVREFHEMINEILGRQEHRKNEVISKLQEFQKEHQETAKMLRELLSKGKELRTKDFKNMLRKFEFYRKDRIARKEERRREVINMLGNFKSERSSVQKQLRTG